MMDSYGLLERLCNLPGVTGFEGPVREAIAEIVSPFVDETRVDTLGNLIAVRRGTSGFKLLLDAHMDEIGFMVQHIDEKGFISFTPIGGWDTRLLPGHMFSVAGRGGKTVFGVIGTHPPHIQKAADVPGVPAQRCPSIQGKGPAITVDDGIRLHPAATIL